MGPRIRDARKRANMTQQALAERCGVSRAAVAQWETGTTRPSIEHLGKVADTLGVWVSWITGEGEYSGQEEEAVPYRPRGRVVPVIDFVQAGDWNPVADPYPPGRGMANLTCERHVGDGAFALVIKGNSMAPDFREGDTVIFDPDVQPQPGDLVVAKLESEDEATFKKYRPRGVDERGRPVIDLVPLNEDWPILRIDAAHPGRVIGTIVEHRRYLRR
ncbi:MAG: XRE family transcriptional regulator [Alphaproteobacteria bacterium]|nr:XRE family transcriptional regulator [Alphaproteobacteria bacterium]